MEDALRIKKEIISFINENGPCLPINISKRVNLSLLFTSAFLSELLSEKAIKMTNLRIGSSPLYYLEGQESKLENFSDYLKGKEKEAFLRLKENKFLIDEEQEPAIRVALRAIKDFAYPFKFQEKIIWRYFLANDEDFSKELFESSSNKEDKEESFKLDKNNKDKEEQSTNQGIEKNEKNFENKKEITDSDERRKSIKEKKNKNKIKSVNTTKKSKRKEENFFERIKEFLKNKNIELLDIINFKDDQATLKIKEGGKEKIFVFINSKKLTEEEIIKLNKKINSLNLNYTNYEIYFFGELSKKIKEVYDSMRIIEKIGKIE
jgi:hypothetical protein